LLETTRVATAAGVLPVASAAARRLVRDVVAEPAAVLRAVVVGPGGHGKTALLDALEAALRAGAMTVRREVPAAGERLDGDVAVLVDDAHLLGADELHRLAALAPARLVVAHRPWPRSAALAALGAALTADRPPVVLEPLDRAAVAARAEVVTGRPPAAAVVDEVHRRTSGVPALVDRLLDAAATGPWPELPAGLRHELGYLLAGLGEAVSDAVLALAIGAPLDADVLGALLGVSAAAVEDVVEAAKAGGVLDAHGAVVPLIRDAVLERAPSMRRTGLQRRLAEVQLERGCSAVSVARGLLGTGATGAVVAEVFLRAGDEALSAAPSTAREFLDAAVAAGAHPLRTAARRAEAALHDGDLDLALAHADHVLSEPDGVEAADLARAGTVAGAALAHRGLLARSAELYRWQSGAGGLPALAVPALIGTGALEEAREVLTAAPRGKPGRPPTLLAGAEELMAQGVYESVAGSSTAAMSQLARAAALLEPSARAALLPDTPAALAALVALHCGELDVAQSVLERAVAVGLGGPAAADRHRLLLAWIAMQRGAIGSARDGLAEVTQGGVLEPRDELLAAALDVGLARRAGDLPGLMAAWSRAREAIVRHPVDLYAFQPLGELVVAAARLREHSWVRPHLQEAQALLDRLGNPPLWAAPLHWSGLQSAVVSDDLAEGERHAVALHRAASSGRYVAAMSAAARQWLALLAGDVDAGAVDAAARGLHAVGLTWEGGRLAGQAAIRTRDRKAMVALLGCARALQSGGPAPSGPAAPPGPEAADGAAATPGAAPEPGEGPLSDRELEVAELVLAGLTYKQIGEQLFISAKTVEHHVARMRQRLGSGSRGELFAQLRSLVGAGRR
jgi:DNA-binding CsgD family transcriptional regulator